jgi:hypothetical protein
MANFMAKKQARKQRTAANSGRSTDGRFARGNRLGFQPGRSGNPKGRPPAAIEQTELLDRLTGADGDHYAAAGRILARGLLRNPERRMGLMEAMRILRDELKGLE